MSASRIENPKHVQGDGAGFGRLRAQQKMREDFASICSRTHPSCNIHIDQIREYAGVQVVFYRSIRPGQFEHARVAVFSRQKSGWCKDSDMIAAQADA
jgi:hypothetical protein